MKPFHQFTAAICFLLFLLLFSFSTGFAQTGQETIPTAQTSTDQQVSWLERYEFGPADVLNFRFYGRPELDREGLRIAPDGTITYLQASNIQVAGKSLDEIRTLFEKELSSYYRNVRLILQPGELRSKRYVILGKVVDKGTYVLDRPISVLEAIARSRGIETGLSEQRTIELADMERSFVIRHGNRLKIDLAALYYDGDLSQNVALEPGDFIYIASNVDNEFYVLGSVNRPGAQTMNARLTLVGALTRREGFSPDAWKEKVLLVRGSLGSPEARIIDVQAILTGKAKDVLIEPRDIIYVNSSPWYTADQILDSAVTAFLQSMSSTWTTGNVPAIIK